MKMTREQMIDATKAELVKRFAPNGDAIELGREVVVGDFGLTGPAESYVIGGAKGRMAEGVLEAAIDAIADLW